MGFLPTFNPATQTPQMLADRRARANAIAQRIGWGTPSIGQGIGDIFRGLGAGFSNYRTDQAEQAGNAYGRSAVDNLSNLLSQPPAAPGMTAPPTNDAVGAAIKSGISTGQTPQLAVYSPPNQASGQTTGQVVNTGAPNQVTTQPIDPTVANPIPPSIPSAQASLPYGGMMGGTIPGGAPFTPAPTQTAVTAPPPPPVISPASDSQPAISVPGYDGTFTQAQANDGDGVPSQAEWLAAAKGGASPASATPAAAPMTPASNNAAMIPQIMQVLNNPWVSESDKAVLRSRLDMLQKQSDPMYQTQLGLAQEQLKNAKAPDNPSIYTDPHSGNSYSYDATDPTQPWKLVHQGEGGGKPTPDQQNYEYAKANGYTGTFMQFKNKQDPNGSDVNNLPAVLSDPQGNVDPTTQQAFLSALPPNDANMVKGMIDYKLDPTKFASLRGNERERLVNLATQADPTFDLSQFKSRQAFKNSLTSGNLSQALMSSNLVIQHMDALLNAADALDNGDYPIKNRVENALKTQTGQASVSNFLTAKKAVAAELAKVFKGVGATDVNSINEWESNFDQNSSPAQIKGAVETATKLLASRIDTVKNQYQSAMGKPLNFRFLTPRSEAVLAARGLDVGGGVPNEPSTGPASQGPVTINDDAGYNALPSGTTFKGPDGQIRKKP